jgi:hypothetical protein
MERRGILYRKVISFSLILVAVAIILMRSLIGDIAYTWFKTDGIHIPKPVYVAPIGARGAVEHEFRIYNLQSSPLVLTAQPDCGCTGLSWKKTSIPPFQWGNITAKMEVKSQHSQTVSIAFRTNRTEKPYLFAFMRTT